MELFLSFCNYVFWILFTGCVSANQSPEQLDAGSALISFYVANLDLSQWSTVDAAFRAELADQAGIFCAHSLEECNVNSNASLSLSADNVVFYAGFPAEVDNNLRVVVGISLSSGQAISLPAVIPQAQLMSIVLINQASLQTAVGSLIGSIALFSEEPITSPLPTVVPSPPSLDIIIENAILIIIEQAPITQWREGSLEQLFRQAVAEVANGHCTSSPPECNIDDSGSDQRRKRSEDPIFDESSTYIIPDYPQAISDSQLEIAFAVTLPSTVTLISGITDYFVPQSTLLSLGLELSRALADLSGAYIIGISAYQPREPPSTVSIWSQVAVGIAIPSALLGLIVLASFMGFHFIWVRGKRDKERYSVENYVGGAGERVKMVEYHRLSGIWSPVESVEEDQEDEEDEFNCQEESSEDCEQTSRERSEESVEMQGHVYLEGEATELETETSSTTLITHT